MTGEPVPVDDRSVPRTASSLLDDPGHRQWLVDGLRAVLTFAVGSIRPDGGFHHLDSDGRPLPGRPPQLFLTARMAYAAGLGVRHGIPAADRLLEHAMASLAGFHQDPVHGGWLTEPGRTTRKAAYDHVHVGLAAASASAVGHPGAAALLEQVVDVVDRHLWDPTTRTLRESFAPDWSDEEAYRGANANMHGVEAFLAIGSVTGDRQWHERALDIAVRLVDGAARANGWLLPEHFSTDWVALPDYNRDDPLHPFRPYGATPGHSLEWARFLLLLDDSPLVDPSAWLAPAAEALTRRALDGGWALDGRPGLVYTVDWAGRPVADVRLHWPLCEAIQACAWLVRRTGDPHWEGWYRLLWQHATRYFVDARGTWRNELDETMAEGGLIWPGRPDVYHCVGALTTPLHV